MEDQIKKWVIRIQQNEKLPSSSIKAYNFGIIETKNGYSIYLIGSSKYNESHDDWACEEDYVPKEKYLHLSKEYGDLEWKEVEKIVAHALRDYVKSEEFENSFLFQATAITIGFDDGDLTRIK